jgi:hypothetical protein
MPNCIRPPHFPPHCGCPAGADSGDTITLVDEGAELLAAHPEPAPRLSIERLLELRGIAFDVATEHLTEEAHQAASAAVAQAEALSVPDTHIAAVNDVVTGAVAGRVLTRAAQLIRERGWIQGDFDDETGALCLWGAVRTASHDLGGETAELDAMDVLRDRIGDRDVSVPMWNDARGRTVGEVLRLLES